MKLFWIKHRIKRFFEDLPLNIACKLPRKIQLWCFIIVSGADGNGPSDEYCYKADYFKAKYNLKGF